MKMLTTGGSGALGRRIARQATEAGMNVRVMSRRSRPAGVQWALDASGPRVRRRREQRSFGKDVVVHAASDPRHQQTVGVEGTRLLIQGSPGEFSPPTGEIPQPGDVSRRTL